MKVAEVLVLLVSFLSDHQGCLVFSQNVEDDLLVVWRKRGRNSFICILSPRGLVLITLPSNDRPGDAGWRSRFMAGTCT